MNLREAILKGAERITGPTQRAFIRQTYTGEYRACALGAAYVGCHPDVALKSLTVVGGHFNDPAVWAEEVSDRIGVVEDTDRGVERTFFGKVAQANDEPNVSTDQFTWDDLISRLENVRIGDTPVLDVEVC